MKILIADDHDLIRDGLQLTLNFVEPAPCFLNAKNAGEVLHVLENEVELDLVLLDLVMPGASDMTLLSQVRTKNSQVPVIVISMMDEPDVIKKAIALGANGFVPKNTPRDILQLAIKIVMAGGIYAPKSIIEEPEKVSIATKNHHTSLPYIKHSRESVQPLTKRQLQVLELMSLGKQNKQIARDLNVSEHTVKVHVTAILNCLGADNRTQAVMRARELFQSDHESPNIHARPLK